MKTLEKLSSGTKIMSSYIGDLYKIPGLKNDKNKIEVMILDNCPTVQDLTEIFSTNYSKDLVKYPLPLYVLEGFKHYAPSTYKRILSGLSEDFTREYLRESKDWVPGREGALLQLQSELSSKSATIDTAIIHHRRDEDTILSKLRHVNRLYHVGTAYHFIKQRKTPILFGNIGNKNEWDEILRETKNIFEEFIQEVPTGNRDYPKKVRKVNASDLEINKKYPYVEYLKKKLGDNLQGIFVYGSSAREEDPSKYQDYDNWIKVKDVKKAFDVLRGTSPHVIEGKVVELNGNEAPKNSKCIGIHIIPDSEDYIKKHERFLHDPREFLLHTKVIYGEFPFWKSSLYEDKMRGISNASIKSKLTLGGLNLAYSNPEKLIESPNLYEFFTKIPRFYLQHILNAEGKPKFRDKSELDHILSGAYNMEVQKPSKSIKKMQEGMLIATENIFKLKKDFLDIELKEPDLSFLTDGKLYTWNDPRLDQWTN